MNLNLFADYENALTYLSTQDYVRLNPLALEVNRRLSLVYTVPDFEAVRLDLLGQLLYSILSQRTKANQADQAFAVLLLNFSDWMELLDEPDLRIEHMIAMTTYPDQKTHVLKAVLIKILEWNDGKRLSLDFLRDLPDVEAAAVLRGLHGVSFKTSYATMLLSWWQRAMLPVDTNGWRVRKRLGLIAEKINDTCRVHAISRALLPENWKAREIEREYFLMKRHGQNCCTYSNPNCGCCPLLDLCRYGQAMQGQRRGEFLNDGLYGQTEF